MKKNIKKLILARETVRALDDQCLTNAKGGTIFTIVILTFVEDCWPSPSDVCNSAGYACAKTG